MTVTSSVLQGSVVAPMLFIIMVVDMTQKGVEEFALTQTIQK